ncbi:MAG: MATE family multidrug resistance protein, partial [Flavobacterium sp.]
MTKINRYQIFLIAWPIILSNISTPLLGIVDTAVIGNLGDPALIGAIALGGIIFSFLFWGFGFLRMGTTGMVAQAMGASDPVEAKLSLYRAAMAGIGIGIVLLCLQVPLSFLSFELFEASQEVEEHAKTYFSIRIWSAPITLCHLAIIGYLLGIQDTRSVLLIQLVLNGMNILLDILFVTIFDWAVPGVAFATVLSEILAFGLGLFIVSRKLNFLFSLDGLLDVEKLKRMILVNRDIMIRTLC